MNIDTLIPVYDEKKRLTPPELFEEIINTVRQIFFTTKQNAMFFDGKLSLDYCLAEQYQWYSKEKIRDSNLMSNALRISDPARASISKFPLHGDLGIELDPEDGRRYYIGTP